jgi:hypothetical protein
LENRKKQRKIMIAKFFLDGKQDGSRRYPSLEKLKVFFPTYHTVEISNPNSGLAAVLWDELGYSIIFLYKENRPKEKTDD